MGVLDQQKCNPVDANLQDCMHILNCIHWKNSPMYY